MTAENTDSQLEYIDSTDYKKLERNINNLNDIAFDLTSKSLASRRLRYAEIDIELERNAGRIDPDGIYTPLHIIDTNIRREQSAYVQYVTQSPRAVILKDRQDPAFDLSLLETDLSEKLRYPGWQIPTYANIDGFQANGYGIKETVQSTDNPSGLADEFVSLGDFSFIADTRDVQKVEMCGRSYYFTKTKLYELTKSGENERWNKEQVDKLISAQPNDEQSNIYSGTTTINRSLYKVMKVMFRVKGVVQVGWCCPKLCNDWLRKPRPLFLGRRKLHEDANKFAGVIQKTPQIMQGVMTAAVKKMKPSITDKHIKQIQDGLPASDEEYETQYPYTLYPYLISENDTIACLKGRIFLDQDTQNAATSLLSSTLTQARRASGLYASKDTDDPNADFLMQKNVNFKPNSLINGKVKQFQLAAPEPSMFTAIQTLVSSNQQETSQVNFAETNRQADSRKTAKAIEASQAQQQQLSGVQVTLYSIALTQQYTYMCGIIKSRVLAGLIVVSPTLKQFYAREWTVKPSGDVDVIQKQKLIETMQQAWPVVQNTACSSLFLSNLLERMFPDDAPKYIQALQQQQQQAQSQQQQQMQQMMSVAKNIASGIIKLSKEPQMFSETGRVHALPAVEMAADKLEQMMQSMQQQKQ